MAVSWTFSVKGLKNHGRHSYGILDIKLFYKPS